VEKSVEAINNARFEPGQPANEPTNGVAEHAA